jgi:hypothetical protein
MISVFNWFAFFKLHTLFKLVPEIVQFCPPQSEII